MQIRVYENTQHHVWNIKKSNTSELHHVFEITYGAVYQISVGTDERGARFTENVTYYAPAILPPYEVEVFMESNGSYIVYWQEHQIPPDVGPYSFEVLVSEGNMLNESTAQRLSIDKPPLIYTNKTSNVYTFSVRIIAKSGYKSMKSEIISLAAISSPLSSWGFDIFIILGFAAVATVAVVALLFFAIRHRRLQNSFSRFANSHYDTRSEAATFDDNGLEEDETPQITGFSDDEPLVIA